LSACGPRVLGTQSFPLASRFSEPRPARGRGEGIEIRPAGNSHLHKHA